MDGLQMLQLLCFIFLIYLAKKESERPLRMEGISNKYNLTYSGPPAHSFTIGSSDRSNIIKGKINGKSVLVYDFNGVPSLRYSFSIGTGGMSVTKRYTIVCIEGAEKKMKGWGGFASTKKIDSILDDLVKGV